MRTLHFLAPAEIDDDATPSGGNHYDRCLIEGLHALGWSVQVHLVAGAWSPANATAPQAVTTILQGLHTDAKVLVDGLIIQAAAAALAAEAARLRLMALLHMPPGGGTTSIAPDVRSLLQQMRAVIVTSAWCKHRLCRQYGLAAQQITVATPGVEGSPLAPGSRQGQQLLCVAAVSPPKGHDILIQALGQVADLPWQLTCAGPTAAGSSFLDHLHETARAAHIADRIRYLGPLPRPELAQVYAAADVLVLASREESYGMVVTEALAHGLPVIASRVGGMAEALGHGAKGQHPGLLIAPESSVALTAALRTWLTHARLRRQLRHAARQRRLTLQGWSNTAHRIAAALARVGS